MTKQHEPITKLKKEKFHQNNISKISKKKFVN